MVKIIAFLVFLCIQLSKEKEIAAVEKPEEDVLQQEILETYPLDIKLDEDDAIHKHVQPPEISKNSRESWKSSKAKREEEYNKVGGAIEKWIKVNKPMYGNYKWLQIVHAGVVAECASFHDPKNFEKNVKYHGGIGQLWSDYTEVSNAIETWMRSYYPSMSRYGWLDIIKEQSYANGIIPRCPDDAEDTYENYDENNGSTGKYSSYDQYDEADDLSAEGKMWDEYTEVTLGVEEWIMEAHPNLQLYKWLKILEEGGILKGRIPKCSAEVRSIYDYYNKGNQISWRKNQDQLTNDYAKVLSKIENWVQEAHPGRSNYSWLDSIEKGTRAKCPDYYNYGMETENYDYHHDIGTTVNDLKEPSYKKPKTQFKRFTSV